MEEKTEQEKNLESKENPEIKDNLENEVNTEIKENAEKKEKPKKKGSLLNDITDIIETVCLWLLIFLLARAYLVDQAIVDGTSMVPTLENEQKVIYSKIYSPDNGDIVIVKNEKLGPLVKRVIAVEGQELDIKDGYVYVDGEKLNEQIYNPQTDGEMPKLTADHFITSLTEVYVNPFKMPEEYPLTIPDGYIFIMGDNRHVSNDSRSADVGFVNVDDVVGKVFMRFWPFSEISFF